MATNENLKEQLPNAGSQVREVKWLAVTVVLVALVLVGITASQPPLDLHSFRQAQTALSSYWLVKTGFKFAYETPVIGPPWSIPFEFPLFELIVGWIHQLTGLSLNLVGRLVSFLFLLLGLIPIRGITRELKLADTVFFIFTAIYFSSPLYLYWGRAFMIETAALFFALCSIYFFIKVLTRGYFYSYIVALSVTIMLSLLQKTTTGLPVALVLLVVLIKHERSKTTQLGKIFVSRKLLIVLMNCFAVPLIVTSFWIKFSDRVKELNPIGLYLTSANLENWNWGSWQQRLSSEFVLGVLWQRVFASNLGSVAGLGVFVVSLWFCSSSANRKIIICSLVLGFLPLILFTNLYIVHDYYLTANLVFFIYALAVALGEVILPKYGKQITCLTVTLILTMNYIGFNQTYLNWIFAHFSKINSRDYAVGSFLKREIPEGDQFVAFGNDWSSTLAYISERKACSVPFWYKAYSSVALHPEGFVEPGRLGAIVSCQSSQPSLEDLLAIRGEHPWKVGEIYGCLIAIPEKPIDQYLKIPFSKKIKCLGAVENAFYKNENGKPVFMVRGWSIMSDDSSKTHWEAERLVVRLSKNGLSPIYIDTVKTSRPDISAGFGDSQELELGFSRLVSLSLAPGNYKVELIQIREDIVSRCELPGWVLKGAKTTP